MQKLKQKWNEFAQKNPKLSQWVREGGLFTLVSTLITIIRGIMIEVLTPLFVGSLGTSAIGFPKNVILNIFGYEFEWYIIGANEAQGGVSYFVAFLLSLWICEIINFCLQRKFVFCSKGRLGRQVVLYFSAFVIVNCLVMSISNIWINVAKHFISSFWYNLGTTFITGGVAMVVFFFANRFIFKESKTKD